MKSEIAKFQNRAENALFQGRNALFHEYKNRAACPVTSNEGGQRAQNAGRIYTPGQQEMILFLICMSYGSLLSPTWWTTMSSVNNIILYYCYFYEHRGFYIYRSPERLLIYLFLICMSYGSVVSPQHAILTHKYTHDIFSVCSQHTETNYLYACQSSHFLHFFPSKTKVKEK